MLILLKLARNTILHAFMLIHSYSVSDIEGKATTIGTTFYQAILNIVKENIHKDLITYPPIYYFPQTGEYQVL